jgi:hypothetical protein
MRAIAAAASAAVFILVIIAPSESQSRRTSTAGAQLPRQPGAVRLQQDILGSPHGAGTQAGPPAHLEMPQHAARPLTFPSPAPKKSPDYNPLVLRHEA